MIESRLLIIAMLLCLVTLLNKSQLLRLSNQSCYIQVKSGLIAGALSVLNYLYTQVHMVAKKKKKSDT